MFFVIHRMVILIAIVLSATAPAFAAAVPSTELDEIFREFSGTDRPGCTLAVDRDDARIITRAWGMADLEHRVPLGPDSVIEAGSVSKQFTAAALVLLALDGKLELDHDVRTYIPELPDYGQTITIRHLINHTSGLRDWGVIAAIHGWPRGSRVHNHDHVVDIASAQKSLNFDPGSNYSYSNTGYNLQAVIVARVSGMSFAQFSQERLFGPLGMSRTQWRDDYTRIVADRAVGYQPAGDGFTMNMPFENVHGNGGLLTTVSDLLTWTRNLATGSVGGAPFIEEMHRRGKLNDGSEIRYASGLMFSSRGGLEEVGHGGATAGYRAYLTRFPQAELAVAVLCNTTQADAQQLAYAVVDQILETTDSTAPLQLDADTLASYTGWYRSERDGSAARISVEDGRLMMNGQVPLEPASEKRFRFRSMRLEFEAKPDAKRRTAFSLETPVDLKARFVPVPDWRPNAETLGAIAGRYYSSEADATFHIMLREEKLFLEGLPIGDVKMIPAFGQAFTAGPATLLFEPGFDGKIDRMNLTTSRVWNLEFQHLDP